MDNIIFGVLGVLLLIDSAILFVYYRQMKKSWKIDRWKNWVIQKTYARVSRLLWKAIKRVSEFS